MVFEMMGILSIAFVARSMPVVELSNPFSDFPDLQPEPVAVFDTEVIRHNHDFAVAIPSTLVSVRIWLLVIITVAIALASLPSILFLKIEVLD